MLLKRFFFLIYHNQLTNLNIFNDIFFKGTHVICYIKFKSLHMFRIVVFFFFPNISIMFILLKLEF